MKRIQTDCSLRLTGAHITAALFIVLAAFEASAQSLDFSTPESDTLLTYSVSTTIGPYSFGNGSFDWNNAVPVPAFDASLGEPDSVCIDVMLTVDHEIQVYNEAAYSRAVGYSVQWQMDVIHAADDGTAYELINESPLYAQTRWTAGRTGWSAEVHDTYEGDHSIEYGEAIEDSSVDFTLHCTSGAYGGVQSQWTGVVTATYYYDPGTPNEGVSLTQIKSLFRE